MNCSKLIWCLTCARDLKKSVILGTPSGAGLFKGVVLGRTVNFSAAATEGAGGVVISCFIAGALSGGSGGAGVGDFSLALR